MGQPIEFRGREKQVIEFLALGRSNKQIAQALGVSVRAIEFHLSNIYAKLGVSSRKSPLTGIRKRGLAGVHSNRSSGNR